MRMRWLILLLCCACPVKRDHGLGPCTDYRPICLSGAPQCDTDSRGCEVCTCAPVTTRPLPPR